MCKYGYSIYTPCGCESPLFLYNECEVSKERNDGATCHFPGIGHETSSRFSTIEAIEEFRFDCSTHCCVARSMEYLHGNGINYSYLQVERLLAEPLPATIAATSPLYIAKHGHNLCRSLQEVNGWKPIIEPRMNAVAAAARARPNVLPLPPPRFNQLDISALAARVLATSGRGHGRGNSSARGGRSRGGNRGRRAS